MKSMRFTRKKNIIREGLKVIYDGKSINAAKRESRRLQLGADGALGRGTLRKLS